MKPPLCNVRLLPPRSLPTRPPRHSSPFLRFSSASLFVRVVVLTRSGRETRLRRGGGPLGKGEVRRLNSLCAWSGNGSPVPSTPPVTPLPAPSMSPVVIHRLLRAPANPRTQATHKAIHITAFKKGTSLVESDTPCTGRHDQNYGHSHRQHYGPPRPTCSCSPTTELALSP
jgi:hypothetical protein